MSTDDPLFEGYRRFRRGRYAAEIEAWQQLAEGQSPHTLIVACSDSRVDPTTIFSAGPGELFVVRNVANLVPPFTRNSLHHGTSAALEFAVCSLHVARILVLGHGECGGIRACMDAPTAGPAGQFIAPWVEIAAPAREEVLRDHGGADAAAQRRALERAAVLLSLHNLKTFPFVREAMDEDRLRLDGAWFSIAEGALHWLDPESGEFNPVPPEL